MLPDNPPSPLQVFRRVVGAALAVAVAALLFVLVRTGHIEWRLVALVLTLWTMWGAGAEVYSRFIEPVGRLIFGQVFSGGYISLDDEIADLKLRLAEPDLEPEREIRATIRLAEIYTRYRADLPRGIELLDRLLLKYPDNAELRTARGLRRV